MSGGKFNYTDRMLTTEMFGVWADYGMECSKDYKHYVRYVRRDNRFEDKLISELIYDVMCLIHSYDWYASGDICEDTYRKDVNFFKKKWLKLDKEFVQTLIDEETKACKEELYKAFEIESEVKE